VSAKNKSWGGRFKTAPARGAQAFTASIGFDVRLYRYDIRGSIAHAKMLAHCGILTAAERDKIFKGLSAVEREIETGKFAPGVTDEDIHMAIERRLTEKVGAVGGKLYRAQPTIRHHRRPLVRKGRIADRRRHR
jgi:argininosuccinate lyase